jgi:hypothetical protein
VPRNFIGDLRQVDYTYIHHQTRSFLIFCSGILYIYIGVAAACGLGWLLAWAIRRAKMVKMRTWVEARLSLNDASMKRLHDVIKYRSAIDEYYSLGTDIEREVRLRTIERDPTWTDPEMEQRRKVEQEEFILNSRYFELKRSGNLEQELVRLIGEDMDAYYKLKSCWEKWEAYEIKRAEIQNQAKYPRRGSNPRASADLTLATLLIILEENTKR